MTTPQRLLPPLLSRAGNHVVTAARALLLGELRIECDQIPFRLQNLPRRKLANWLLAEAAARVRPARTWGWPTHLMVEASSKCNLRCALCPVTAGLGRPQGHMDPALFRKVIDEIGAYLMVILLWDWGEPFVNPDIYEMIAYAHRQDIKTISSTNGHPFTSVEAAEKVVRSGLDSLIFAIDGTTQATYERFRQGGNLEGALTGVRNVAAAKRALASNTPLVNFRFIVMKHNEHEIPRARELAAELGANAFTLKTMNPYAQDPYSGARAEVSSWEEFVPRDMRYRRFKENAPGERRKLARNPCKNLWHHPTLHWNGVVSPCTYDPRELFPLGDLRTQSFREVWQSAAYRGLRGQFRADSNSIELCRECSYAYAGGNCQNETMAGTTFYSAEG